MMDSEYIEDVASSLVREYLSRKGLRRTLQCMDNECPRGLHCINNRLELVKSIHIEKLMRKNKELAKPHRSMIEVIARYFLEKAETKFGALETLIRQDSNDPSKVSPHFSYSSLGRPRSKTRQEVPKSFASGDLVLEDDFDVGGEAVVGCGKEGLLSKESSEEEEQSIEIKMERMQRSRPRSQRNPYAVLLEQESQGLYQRPMKDFEAKEKDEKEKEVVSETSSSDKDYVPKSPKSNNIQDPFQDLLAGQEGHRPRVKPTPPSSDQSAPVENPENLEDLEYKVSESSISKANAANAANSNNGNPAPAPPPVRPMNGKVESRPIDEYTAVSLKSVVLGSGLQVFVNPWKFQSFSFVDFPKLLYGIIQKKEGPCGVLAAVQASLLQALLYAEDRKPTLSSLSPSRTQRSEFLAQALANIFWRCGSRKKAVVALPSMRPHFSQSHKYKSDQLTETLILSTVSRKEDLVAFIKQNISQFELDGTSGVILALYSAILSRGVAGVRSDMDDPMGKLMGDNWLCSQAMVNLLVVGRAVNNIFNDVIERDEEDGKRLVMKGLPGRSDIGLLTLSEHYKQGRVGTYFKTPRFPIWLIFSEKHYSILFCLKKELLSDWKAERRFDLYYYDGLAKQEEEIRLTIDTSNRFFKPPVEDDMVPPIEHCIRTKWCDAEVDWNGIEPIL